jgi:predicted ATPase/DNA-binding SARP family transcriptional activator
MPVRSQVRIDLLGGFAVSVGPRKVADQTWRLRKAKAMVKLLALAPEHRLPWEQLGELLWPDRNTEAVRNNFHQTLRAARLALGSVGLDGREVLRLHDGVLGFGDDVDVVVDVDEFTAAVQRARDTGDLDAHRDAVGLYPGELLPEDRYEHWTSVPRETLREQHAALLLTLASRHREHDEPAVAIDLLRTLLLHDELHEPARRELMRMLADAGRRQEALAEYEALRDALRRRLEADPDPETRRLYRRLLVGSVDEPRTSRGDDALSAAPAPGSNLPMPASSFVGRDREVAEVERLLTSTRLLTLTGVGGAGKTRLALEVARRQLDAFDQCVWLVDLARISDPVDVPQAVAESLSLELPERGDPVPPLIEQLAPKRLLLVADNCEHLIDACAEFLAAVLGSCPDVQLLATSREALRIEGEVAWRVPSLALPDLRRLPDHRALAHQASVRLFCERAAAAEPRFELTARNAATVAEVCIRLDGMPLALELAAARVPVLPPAQILERLGAMLDLPGGRRRAGLSRQRTLSAALDWSHDLLGETERVTFRRLAVFNGSFSVEAAEHVCAVDPLSCDEVMGLLGRLVDQSLVTSQSHSEVARYRLIETVRQYAGARLDGAGERPVIEQRHRDWYRRWVEEHDPELAAAAGEESLRRFEVEHDNLRAALRSALVDEPETALRLATSLWRFWLSRGYFAEGRRWLSAALEAEPAPTALRARGLIAIAVLDMRYASSTDRLEKVAAEVVDIHQTLDDEVGFAQALHLTAVLLWTAHRVDAAEEQLDRACVLSRELGAHHLLAAATHTRGVLALGQGRPAEARSCFEMCGDLLGELEDPERGFFPAISIGFPIEWDAGSPRLVFEETLVMGHRLDLRPAVAFLHISHAWAARAAGELEGAVTHARESSAGFAIEGWAYGVALADNLLGNLYRQMGDHASARRFLERSLRLRARLGDRRATGVTLGALGMLAAAEGDQAGTQRYLRRALGLFERIEDGFGTAGTLLNLGVASLRAGDLDAAEPHLEHIRELGDIPGGRRLEGWGAVMLAEIARRRGDEAAAGEYLTEAWAIFTGIGEQMGLMHCERLERDRGR